MALLKQKQVSLTWHFSSIRNKMPKKENVSGLKKFAPLLSPKDYKGNRFLNFPKNALLLLVLYIWLYLSSTFLLYFAS